MKELVTEKELEIRIKDSLKKNGVSREGRLMTAHEWLLYHEFVDYGYVKVTRWLQQQDLIINKKKVHRLTRIEGLLPARPKRRGTGKTRVEDLVPQPGGA